MANFDLFNNFKQQIEGIHDFDDDIDNLFDDRKDDDDAVVVADPGKNKAIPVAKSKRKKKSQQINFEDFINDDSDGDTDHRDNPVASTSQLLLESQSERLTRSKLKDLLPPAEVPRGKRGRGRGRGRARGRNSVGRGRGRTAQQDDCIDLCSPVAPKNGLNDSIIIDDDEDNELSNNLSFESENYEISIKVYWNLKLHKLVMRRFQKFECIIQKLGEIEKVNASSIVLTLDDQIISASDTPESINYKTSQFMYGRAMEHNTEILDKIKTKKRFDPNAIEIKIQSAIMKKPLFVQILKQQNMKIAIIRCAEELKENAKDLQLRFDGEIVDVDQTPDDLELEGGEIFDVIINKT